MEFVSVSDQLWRGPQPDLDDLVELQEYGLTGVVNLRDESEESKPLCEELGLSYHYFPVEDATAPHHRQVEAFLQLLEETPDDKFLVHCNGGIGRAGAMVGCYRVWMGWMSPAEAIEATDEECYPERLDDVQREFVMDFGESIYEGANGDEEEEDPTLERVEPDPEDEEDEEEEVHEDDLYEV